MFSSSFLLIYRNTERIHDLAKHPWQDEDQEKSNQLIISKYSPGYLHLNIYSYPQYFPSFPVMFINSGTTGVTHDSKSAKLSKEKIQTNYFQTRLPQGNNLGVAFEQKKTQHAWSIPQMSVISHGSVEAAKGIRLTGQRIHGSEKTTCSVGSEEMHRKKTNQTWLRGWTSPFEKIWVKMAR